MGNASSNGHHPAVTAAEQLQRRWDTDPRWAGIQRTYSAADVIKLRPSLTIEHTLARRGAERLREQLRRRQAER